MTIETVRGPVDATTMGPFLAHEHILVDMLDVTLDSNSRLEDPQTMIAEVTRFREAGGNTIIEVTPDHIGRDPLGLKAISEATYVHIVMGCGYYWEPFYPPTITRTDTNALAGQFIDEIENGVGTTGIRPGVIGEVGSHRSHISPAEERVMRAAARAQLATGLTITTHSPFERIGLAHVDLLREEGVTPESIVVGHMDHRPFDLDYQLAVARSGVFFEYDMVGRTDLFPDTRRVDLLVAMLRRGYGEQILLSSDIFRRSHLATFGGHGYNHLLTSFLPKLREAGVDEATIVQLVTENPRRAFSKKLPSSRAPRGAGTSTTDRRHNA